MEKRKDEIKQLRIILFLLFVDLMFIIFSVNAWYSAAPISITIVMTNVVHALKMNDYVVGFVQINSGNTE